MLIYITALLYFTIHVYLYACLNAGCTVDKTCLHQPSLFELPVMIWKF